jgi:pimeloyl-ACP methyl ester carboxylesterase
VRKLVLYEPPRPDMIAIDTFAALERLAAGGDWDGFAFTFFRDAIGVPTQELEAVRASELWPPIVTDAPASLGDLRALRAEPFHPGSSRGLPMPVCLQVGSESRHELYVTDALAAELPHAHLTILHGQAHEGMTTAPEQYADAVTAFLLD